MVTTTSTQPKPTSVPHGLQSPQSASSISEIDSFSDSGMSDSEDPLSGSWLDVESLQDFGDSGSSDISQQSDDGVDPDTDVQDDVIAHKVVEIESTAPLFGQPPSNLGSSYVDPDASATSLNSSMGTISSSTYRLAQPTDQSLILPDPMSDSYASTVAKAPSRFHSFLADPADIAGTPVGSIDRSWFRGVGEGDDESSRADGEYSLLNSKSSDELKASSEFFTELAVKDESAPLVRTLNEPEVRVIGKDMARKWALRTALFALASVISLAAIGSLSYPTTKHKTAVEEMLMPIRSAETTSVFTSIWQQVSSPAAPDPTDLPSDLRIVKNALSTFYAGIIKIEEVVMTTPTPPSTAAESSTPKMPMPWRQRFRSQTALDVVKPNSLQKYMSTRPKVDRAHWRGRVASSTAPVVTSNDFVGTTLKRAARAGLALSRHAERVVEHALALVRQDTERLVSAFHHASRATLHRAARGAKIVRTLIPSFRFSVRAPPGAAEAHEAIIRARASLDTLTAYVEQTSKQARRGLENVLEDTGLRTRARQEGKVRSRTSRVLEMAHHAALQVVL